MKAEDRNELIVRSKDYKKSNELINAMGIGTALSQKLFAVGMLNMHIDETNNVVATIRGSQLRKLFNSTSGSLYQHIEELCDQQMKGSTIFQWQLLFKDKEKGKIEAHQVVTDAYFKDGTLTLRYNNFLTDKITNLKKGYTTLSLSETLSLKSIYSLRMYEIFKSAYDYQKAIKKTIVCCVIEYSLVELKLELGIITTGGNKEIKAELEKEYPDYERIGTLVDAMGKKVDNRYKEYKVFNRCVLSKVKEELNGKTCIEMDYESIKSGKRVVGVRFFINRRDLSDETVTAEEFNEDDILDDLYEIMHENFKLSELKEILRTADYNSDKVKKSYEYMRNYNIEIENSMAFMKECIKKEYYLHPQKSFERKNGTLLQNFMQREQDFSELEEKLLDN
ncbi:replication initiation protein repB4 (plasmid) [Butyrivibrio proteoclasticus B316]|uniref:Replication initiation protein repB4 n=2 Tax=Butyrivibrio proteoclasticus TaxID=43305 RepID=E0S502_BUTPB|nr:replication initiation protein repB4 [Butyrivibrio proteoclasticus B316]